MNELSQKKGKQERIVKQEPGEKRKKRKLIIVEADDDAPDSADLAQQQQLEFMEEEIPEKGSCHVMLRLETDLMSHLIVLQSLHPREARRRRR